MVKWSRERIRRFAADENGLIMTEFLLMLPLFLWAFMAMVVYWDTWRTINEAQKASYAVADVISRQASVDEHYIDGMLTVMHGLMSDRRRGMSMRVTSVEWLLDEDDNGYHSVIFSYSPNNRQPQLSNDNIADIANLIPEMNPGDSTVILETWTDFIPSFMSGEESGVVLEREYNSDGDQIRKYQTWDIGIPNSTFRNFIVTKPRYHVRICLDEQWYTCPAESS